jgi:large subunit ribosomal protein L13
MKTYSATPRDIEHQWYIVDAEGQVLGRLATAVANIIRGKHKPMFTPHMDTGDNVIVINAAKVRVTGKKAEQKRPSTTGNWVGALRRSDHAHNPERVIERPSTACCRRRRSARPRQAARFADAKHTHAAQQPKVLDLNKKSEK